MMQNPWTQGLTDSFNPANAFNQGNLAMPAALGLTEAVVRSVGVPAAYKMAQVIARKHKKPVLVPIPGKGQCVVARPPKKQKRRPLPMAFVPRRKATVLQAQTRAPMPDAYTKLGRRGPLPAKALKKTARLAEKHAGAEAAVDRKYDAIAAARSSNATISKKVVPMNKKAPAKRGGWMGRFFAPKKATPAKIAQTMVKGTAKNLKAVAKANPRLTPVQKKNLAQVARVAVSNKLRSYGHLHLTTAQSKHLDQAFLNALNS